MRIPFPKTFSLRALLIGVLLVALACAPVASQLKVFREQERAVAQLIHAHRPMRVEWEPSQPYWFWQWLETASGIRCQRAVTVAISNHPCDEASAQHLLALPYIRSLELHTGVTNDRVMGTISRLTTLEHLRVCAPMGLDKLPSAPTNEGVRSLAALHRLKSLELQSAVVRDASGRSVAVVDDEGFRPVAANLGLKNLDVIATRITIDGIRPLLAQGTLAIFGGGKAFADHIDELLENSALQRIELQGMSASDRTKGRGRVFDAH